MPYSIDTEAWPLVRLTLEGALSHDDVTGIQRDYEELYTRQEEFVNLVDARRLQVDRRLAGSFGEWMKSHLEDIRTYAKGTALVNDSSLFRFLISGMSLIQPLPHPYIITGSLKEAETWIRELLQKAGLVQGSSSTDVDQVGS